MSAQTPPDVMAVAMRKQDRITQLSDSPAGVRDELFADFQPLLSSLDDQFQRIREFNHEFWGNALPPAALDNVDTATDHVQSVDDLEVLHVELGSPATTLDLWWTVIAQTQPRSSRWLGAVLDDEHLRLAESAAHYAPGIHRVRINLVANWCPATGRTVAQARAQARSRGQWLAHSEALAAFGLHPALLERVDGDALPFVDLAGFELRVPGDSSWNLCPSVYWPRGGRRVDMDVYFADGIGYDWAAPTVGRP
jgi:hypothetical protein